MARANALAPAFEPGIHRGVKAEVYHEATGLSRSRLWTYLSETPRHAHINPPMESSGFLIGDAAHCALLEPHEVRRRFVIYEGRRDKRTKDYKAFLQAHPGKQILSVPESKIVNGLVDRIGTSEKGKWVFSSGEAEVSFFWQDEDSGFLLKARPDWVCFERDLIVDVKTTKSVKSWSLRKTIREYGYHFQQHHYSIGYHALTGRWPRWGFLFLDKGPRVFEFRFVCVNPRDLELAAEQHQEAMAGWAECTKTGVWPSYPDEFETLEPCFNHDRL